MRNMVKFGFIAAMLSLLSCSNNFPDAPEFLFCKFTAPNDEPKCESIHVVTARDCDAFNGEIVETCKPETE